MVSQLTDALSSTNLILFKCVTTIKKIQLTMKNYGDLMSLIIIVIEGILILNLYFCQLNPVLIKITKEINFNPPKTNYSMHAPTSSNYPINDNTNNTKEINLFNDLTKKTPPKVMNNNNFTDPDPEELNSLDFEEAKEKDHRSFMKYYLNIISEKQVIFSPFFYNSLFQPFSLRLIMFIFCVHTFLFINALFFTEEYISKRYDTKDKLDFFYILQNEINKSLLGSIITLIIQKIFSLFTTKTSLFYKLIRENQGNQLKFQLKKLVRTIKRKIILLIAFIFIFTLAFLYFIHTNTCVLLSIF